MNHFAFLLSSYSTGKISGSDYVGGLVGKSLPRVEGTRTTGSVTSSFWDFEASGQDGSAGGILASDTTLIRFAKFFRVFRYNKRRFSESRNISSDPILFGTIIVT